MTTRKPSKSAALKAKRQRKILELQMREYIARYHPEFGEVSVQVSPENPVARVRRKSREKIPMIRRSSNSARNRARHLAWPATRVQGTTHLDTPIPVRHSSRPMRLRTMPDSPHRDPVQEFADRIVAEFEKGVKPWVRPWDPEKSGGPQAPFNPVTGKRYHGINVLILGMDIRAYQTGDPRWMTFQQAREKQWHVRKGDSVYKACLNTYGICDDRTLRAVLADNPQFGPGALIHQGDTLIMPESIGSLRARPH